MLGLWSTVPMPGSSVARPHESPFAKGADARELRIVVDTASVSSSPALEHLLGLGHHPDVDIATTTDVGLDTLTLGDSIGSDGLLLYQHLHHRSAATWLRAVSNADRVIEEARRHAKRWGLDEQEFARRLMVLAAADESGADVAVVAIDLPHDLRRRPRLPPSTVDQALAHVGLFLRSRDDQRVVHWPSGTFTQMAIASQFLVTARTIQPAGWRWRQAYLASQRGGDDLIRSDLSWGVFLRLERALMARDHVMIERLRPFEHGSMHQIGFNFDALVLWLGGAFDVVAAVASDVYDLDIDQHLAGWSRRQFRGALARIAPSLHAMTELGTPIRSVIDLVAAFRNTIHGEPISGSRSWGSRSYPEYLLVLPEAAERRAVDACAVLGGATAWGQVHPDRGSGGRWDPYVVVQLLLAFAAGALNALMDATDVERMAGVPGDRVSGPPPDYITDSKTTAAVLRLNGFGGSYSIGT